MSEFSFNLDDLLDQSGAGMSREIEKNLADPTKPMKTTRSATGRSADFGTLSIGEVLMGTHNVNSAEHVGELQDVAFTHLLSGFLSSGAGKGKFGRKGGPIGTSGANYDLIVPDDVKELASAYTKKFPHPDTAADDDADGSQQPGAAPAAASGGNGTAAQIVDYALSICAGHAYSNASDRMGPDKFDCSGLVHVAVTHFGLEIPTVSGPQFSFCQAHGTEISVEEGKRTYGALLFTGGGGSSHIEFSKGNGRAVGARSHASGCGEFNQMSNYSVAAKIPGATY